MDARPISVHNGTSSPKETLVEDNRNGSRITRTETEASGGSIVRYVLIVGLVLVAIAFVAAYLFK
jgi:hypothetical protein